MDKTQIVAEINTLSDGVKKAYFEIADLMVDLKARLIEEGLKKGDITRYITEQTGYEQKSISRFMNAKIALENLQNRPRGLKQIPDSEKVIRPLATTKFNADPETQTKLWAAVVEEADGAVITAAMVKAKVKEHKALVNPQEPKAPRKTQREWEREVNGLKTQVKAYEEIFEGINKDDLGGIFDDDMGQLIIKAGTRAVAMKLHPDHGGSEEMMQLVNEKVAALKKKGILK